MPNYILPAIVLLLWVAPVSALGYWTAPLGTEVASFIRIPALSLVLLYYVGSKRLDIHAWTALFLLSTLGGVVLAAEPGYSFVRFLGLGAIVAVCGPLVICKEAKKFRSDLWTVVLWTSVLIVAVSLSWKMIGISKPVLYLKEGFPGLTSHAMLFGPLAAIATVVLLRIALVHKSYWYFLAAIISYGACLMSGSRAAVAAGLVGILATIAVAVRLERTGFLVKSLVLAVATVVILTFMVPRDVLEPVLGPQATWQQKGLTNTRAELWGQRLLEFREQPLFGIGLGVARYTTQRTVNDIVPLGGLGGKVEPGSAYLVVLAMTGLAGALTLVATIWAAISSATRYWDYVPMTRRMDIAGIGFLLAVHGLAEGWVYSPGTIMCIVFWTWLGITVDAGREAKLAVSWQHRNLLAKQRIAKPLEEQMPRR